MNSTQKPVAIVTGASSGIGLGITLALIKQGYNVVGTSRTISKSKELKGSVDLVLIDGDVGKKETAVKVAAGALEHFGRIDLLVNNAGIFIPKPFTDYTEADYDLVMSTNVASYFFMTQQVIPQMKKQNSGHVVNISTVMTDQPSGSAPALLAVLSKSTMPAVSKALALEYAADGIRVNTVSLGVVNTPMHANDDHDALRKFHPLGRMGEISDVVEAVLYLQSASFVTGENLRVDGGVHAGRP
jgi:NAD(P)-dependent dehydrogenase (short-subunit alcohol dehydrogenase family)